MGADAMPVRPQGYEMDTPKLEVLAAGAVRPPAASHFVRPPRAARRPSTLSPFTCPLPHSRPSTLMQ